MHGSSILVHVLLYAELEFRTFIMHGIEIVNTESLMG